MHGMINIMYFFPIAVAVANLERFECSALFLRAYWNDPYEDDVSNANNLGTMTSTPNSIAMIVQFLTTLLIVIPLVTRHDRITNAVAVAKIY